MRRMEWRDSRPDVLVCAHTLRKMNEVGKEIPEGVFAQMNARFSTEEIGFIESYLFLENTQGSDYLTQEEMIGQS